MKNSKLQPIKLPSQIQMEQFYLLSVIQDVKHAQRQIQTHVLPVLLDILSKVKIVFLVHSLVKLVRLETKLHAYHATAMLS